MLDLAPSLASPHIPKIIIETSGDGKPVEASLLAAAKKIAYSGGG